MNKNSLRVRTEYKTKQAKRGALRLVFSRTALIFSMLLLQIAIFVGIISYVREYAVVLYFLMQIVGLVAIIKVITDPGDSAFKLTWILVIFALPVFGTAMYIWSRMSLGSRFLEKRLSDLRLETNAYMMQDPRIFTDLKRIRPAHGNLSYYMANQLHYPTYRNTDFMYFPSGQDKFEQMLIELQGAEEYIFLEYFIVEKGYMWDQILKILKRKAREGVEVRVMYDGMCSLFRLPYNYPEHLEKYGIKCKIYNQIRPIFSTVQNNRDHRKICVVDGRVAFTGGVNISDEYINRKKRFGYWKDAAILLRGNAVQSFTMMFLELWNIDERTKEDYGRYQTVMSNVVMESRGFAIPYADSPYDHENVGEQVFCHILNQARQYVHIMTPYLIINQDIMNTLKAAAKSGIDVKLIMPGIPDKWYAYAVAKTYYEELMQAGVKIYEFIPGFVHAKFFVSDDETAAIGTINLDYRSLYLHHECGVFVYNNDIIDQIEDDFQHTLSKCRKVTEQQLKKRSVIMKVAGKILRLFAPIM